MNSINRKRWTIKSSTLSAYPPFFYRSTNEALSCVMSIKRFGSRNLSNAVLPSTSLRCCTLFALRWMVQFQIHITIFCVGHLIDSSETQIIFYYISRHEYILRSYKENELKILNRNWLKDTTLLKCKKSRFGE